MPTAKEIEQSLFALAPHAGAMEWDNVGLLVGRPESRVDRVLVALDVTEQVADEALTVGAQLIIAHHPLMNCTWLPVQTVRDDTPQGRLLMKLICGNLSAICMHTNLDVTKGGVNDALVEALELVDPGPLAEDGIGRVGTLPAAMLLTAFAARVNERLHCNGLRYCDAGKPVSRVAVGGGACVDYLKQALAAGCDTFVTSDVGYHDFQNAQNQGVNLLDAGHFPTENVICPVLIRYLREQFPALTVLQSQVHREIIQYYVKGAD